MDRKKKFSLKSSVLRIDYSQPQKSKCDAPYLLKFEYIDDLNIIQIHDAIRLRIGSMLEKIDCLKEAIADLDYALENNITTVEKNELISQKNILQKEYDELITGKRWQNYVDRTKQFLEEYVCLASDESKGNIVIGKKTEQFTKEQIEKRIFTIQNYIDIAKDYITLDIIWKGYSKFTCPLCENSLCESDQELMDDDFGLFKCSCGYVFENMDKTSHYNTDMFVNIINKNYSSHENFEKTFLRWEGSSSEAIPSKLFTKLDEFFIKKGFPDGQTVRNLPILGNGKKKGTSISLIVTALRGSENSPFYYLLFPIVYAYWGWKCPCSNENYDHDLGEKIIEKYFVIQEIYPEVKTRESCLNVQIMLYFLLCSENYPCEQEDFKFLITRECLEDHHNTLKKICERRKDIKFTPLI